MLGFLLYGGSGTGELAEAGNGVRQWALCKISMKDSAGVVIWIPSALSPYDLLSAFRLRCTVHPQQGQPQPVGGGFQPGEPERSQLITVQTIWRSAFMFWLIDFRCFLWLCWWLSRWTSWALLPYPLPHHDSSLFSLHPSNLIALEGVSVWIYHFIHFFKIYSSCTESVIPHALNQYY